MAKSIHLSFPLLSFFTVAIVILSLASPTFSEQRPKYLGFTVNGTEMPEMDFYDYIVVGGGTAGCPLAATLSKNYKVLLLERGGVPYGKRKLITEEGFHSILEEELSINVDDPSDSPVEHFTSSGGVSNARGRVLGGSSAIGAGFYSRADRDFFDLSGIKWDSELVKESYRWVEKAIVFEPKLKNWQSSVFNGLIEAKIGPANGYSLSHNLGTKIGGSTFDHDGRRYSAADLLSYYANPLNIKVVTHAIVEMVTFAYPAGSSQVTGVIYRDKQGTKHIALLRNRGEVLLSAGALGSPQILRMSGIGNRDILRRWQIPMVRHNPFVGHFLHDSPRNGISIIVPSMPVEQSLMKVVGVTNSGEFLEAASYIVEFNARNNTGSFVKRSNHPVNFTAATLMVKVSRPQSNGYLHHNSTDMKMSPQVWFNYFHHPDDLDKCVNGIRKIHDVLQTRSMEEFKYPQHWGGVKDFRYLGPPLPADLSDDAVIKQYCRRTVSTSWDYHGGCVVGKVVDESLKVLGIDSLRVVDGSIFTVSPGTNPQATVMMLGRYTGMRILRSRNGFGADL